MRLRRLAPLLCLSVVSLLIWCAATDRWSVEAWRTPLQLHGDPAEVYARVKIAAEDLTQPLRGYADLPRLAAPLGADWRPYPVSDRVVFTFLGALARLTDVFVAMNLAMAGVHVLNALSFYLCARLLRWRPEWAFATALLFAFANYNFRWGVTVSFSLTFAIPPFLLLCGWIARPAPPVRARAWTWLAVALGAWFGTANPYLGFFAAQLVVLSLGLQLLRGRAAFRCRAGLLFLGALAVVFLLHCAPYLLADRSASLARNYAGSEVYALKLADLVIPPAEHRVPALAALGQSYSAQSALRGEFFINYVGLFGVAGLLLLGWSAAQAAARPRVHRFPDAALGAAWLFLFSSVGGLNSLLALGGLDLFRASNRNSIFLLVWALWFFGRWCQRHTRRLPLWPRLALPLLVGAVGVLDSLPRLPAKALLRAHAEDLRPLRQLTSALEQQLGADARIFQVPSPPFPEAGRIGQMDDYAGFLPYLVSSHLRFSYGAFRETAAARYLEALANAPAPLLRATLERCGFRAIWIDRRASPDGYAQLIAALQDVGAREIAQSMVPHLTLFALDPAPHPVAPDLNDPRILPAWNPGASDAPFRIAALDGWYDLERDATTAWRWAQQAAAAGVFLDETATVRLSFAAFSARPGQLVLEIDGIEVWRKPTSWQTRERHHVSLPLAAGSHRLVWKFDGPVQRASPGDPRQIGFALADLAAAIAPPEMSL